jgi:hypothetical protein
MSSDSFSFTPRHCKRSVAIPYCIAALHTLELPRSLAMAMVYKIIQC